MNPRIEQFAQIAKGPVWDGNLISKDERDHLFKSGLINRREGWNFITEYGMGIACHLGILKP